MDFHNYTADFTSVSPSQAQTLLTSPEKTILFLGRASCPYCNRFVPKLHQVAADKNLTVHFLDTSLATKELQELREAYQVPTVPGLIYAEGETISVRCDSSMTVEEIAQFVGV